MSPAAAARRSNVAGRVGSHAADTLNSVPVPRLTLFAQAARRPLIAVALSALMMVVSGCTVSPPPAPQSTDTSESTPTPPPRATQIIMAIDSIGPGFNPHLLSDQSPVNAAIGSLGPPTDVSPLSATTSTTAT